MTIEVAVQTFLKLALLACAALYTGMTVIAYRTHASIHSSQLHWRAPARAALQFVGRLGVKALTPTVALGKATFELLTEASADVGEMFVRRHGGEA